MGVAQASLPVRTRLHQPVARSARPVRRASSLSLQARTPAVPGDCFAALAMTDFRSNAPGTGRWCSPGRSQARRPVPPTPNPWGRTTQPASRPGGSRAPSPAVTIVRTSVRPISGHCSHTRSDASGAIPRPSVQSAPARDILASSPGPS